VADTPFPVDLVLANLFPHQQAPELYARVLFTILSWGETRSLLPALPRPPRLVDWTASTP
jgi:hypothetical protein